MPDMHNWCGLKTRNPQGDGREEHTSVPDNETGIKAHFQHLAGYIVLAAIDEVVDPRYGLVKNLPWAGTIKFV